MPWVAFAEVLFAAEELRIEAEAKLMLSDFDVWIAVIKHGNGDWGEVDVKTRIANLNGLLNYGTLRSAFISSRGVPHVITTSGDRTSSTISVELRYQH